MAGWILFLVSLFGAFSLPGSQCVMFDKPDELWAASDLVFLGTVLETKPTGKQGDHVIVEIATFRVDRAWKGKPEKTAQVGGDAPFEKGTQYLVFAAGKPPSTTLPCRWTEPADRAKAKIDWLTKRSAADQRRKCP